MIKYMVGCLRGCIAACLGLDSLVFAAFHVMAETFITHNNGTFVKGDHLLF